MALGSGCQQARPCGECKDPAQCPLLHGHCWMGLQGTLVSPLGCFSTPPAVSPLPPRAREEQQGQGIAQEVPSTVLAWGIHFAAHAGMIYPQWAPIAPPGSWVGVPWGPRCAGSWVAAGRRPPRLLQAGIELLCLEPVRH